MRDHDVELPDGRTVSLAEYGDPAGRPVVHLHGAASCRFEAEPFDTSAAAQGVRIISLDRPGVGRSSECPGRTVVGYGHDVGAVADALGLEQFTISGFSNGGMYAFAVAHALGDRISKVVPINPTTPAAEPDVRAVLPRWARFAYAATARFPARVARAGQRQGLSTSGLIARINPDRHVMMAAETHALITRINAEPKSDEYCLSEVTLGLAQPWGFDHLEAKQPVELFTGERDAGRRYAEIWAAKLPNATLHLFPGGHMGFFAEPVARTITERFATP